MQLGQRIQQLRKAAGLSQEQLAEFVKVSRQSISKWETDQAVPELDKILLLSRVFVISTDALLDNQAAEGAEGSGPQLSDLIHENRKRRRMTIGWITVLVGAVLLILEFFSLRVIQLSIMRLALEHNSIGFFENPMRYAEIQPMPVIFMLTTGILLTGTLLILVSPKNNRIRKK